MSGHKPWSEIRRKTLKHCDCIYCRNPLVPEWAPVRQGSNLEVPNFRPTRSAARFPLATGKSKKLYLRALSRGFRDAAMRQDVRWSAALRACRANEGVADRAFYRLQRLEART